MLLVITPERSLENEQTLGMQMLDSGLSLLHIRKPGLSEQEYKRYLEQFEAPYRAHLVLHEHHNLAKSFGCAGVHLKSRQQPLPDVPVLSSSNHSLAEVAEKRFEGKHRYFLSPVFPSISKPGYSGKLQAQAIKQFTENNPSKNLIALGGIQPKNIKSVKEMGFKGMAVLGYIWQAQHPVEAYLELQRMSK